MLGGLVDYGSSDEEELDQEQQPRSSTVAQPQEAPTTDVVKKRPADDNDLDFDEPSVTSTSLFSSLPPPTKKTRGAAPKPVPGTNDLDNSAKTKEKTKKLLLINMQQYKKSLAQRDDDDIFRKNEEEDRKMRLLQEKQAKTAPPQKKPLASLPPPTTTTTTVKKKPGIALPKASEVFDNAFKFSTDDDDYDTTKRKDITKLMASLTSQNEEKNKQQTTTTADETETATAADNISEERSETSEKPVVADEYQEDESLVTLKGKTTSLLPPQLRNRLPPPRSKTLPPKQPTQQQQQQQTKQAPEQTPACEPAKPTPAATAATATTTTTTDAAAPTKAAVPQQRPPSSILPKVNIAPAVEVPEEALRPKEEQAATTGEETEFEVDENAYGEEEEEEGGWEEAGPSSGAAASASAPVASKSGAYPPYPGMEQMPPEWQQHYQQYYQYYGTYPHYDNTASTAAAAGGSVFGPQPLPAGVPEDVARDLASGTQVVEISRANIIDAHRSWTQAQQLQQASRPGASAGEQKQVSVQAKFWDSKAGTVRTVDKGQPTRLHKRKHQINQLAFDVIQREAELTEARLAGNRTKAETWRKYGWS